MKNQKKSTYEGGESIQIMSKAEMTVEEMGTKATNVNIPSK